MRRRIPVRPVARLIAVGTASLVAASLVVGTLERDFAVPNASSVYVVAVVVTAIASGTIGALLAAVGSFLLYDFLFVDPRHTLTVSDPGEWLNLVVLLFVGAVVGQLTAVQRRQADRARGREREAVAQFRISRALATRKSTAEGLADVADILVREAGMERIWIALGADDAEEHTAADTGSGSHPGGSGFQVILQRMPGDIPAHWQRVHEPGRRRPLSNGAGVPFRVRVQAGETPLGSVWGIRSRAAGAPDRTQTRLLSAAADQIAQMLAHDRLAAEGQAAEVARQSDALKTALLQSVSHDLRTPLATIRAAAGSLRPDADLGERDRRESAAAIEREVEYLNRLVTNLLDLSRIEAGALRAELDVYELDDLVGRTLERLGPRLADHSLTTSMEVVSIEVDAVFLDEAVTNVLENAIKHCPAGAPIRISGHTLDGDWVRLTIEDGGPGVPDSSLGQIFDKFYRVPGGRSGSRAGTGIGLAVVRGLLAVSSGRVAARRSALGGLAVDIDLPAAGARAATGDDSPR
jgi:two-component system sensor histidine kinase KdpD